MSASLGHVWRLKLQREFGVSASGSASVEALRAQYEALVAERDGGQVPLPPAVPPGPRRPRVAGRPTVPAADNLEELAAIAERLEGAVKERRRLVREAVSAGVPVRVVAEAAGLSKSEVARLAPRSYRDDDAGAGPAAEGRT